MRQTFRALFGFLAILAVGVIGVLVGNHFEWFSDNTATAVQSQNR